MENTTSQSSKVTVEYHDPSAVFPLISRDIAARLPLRNLNWQSPPRPLRQIRSLHVEFVPDKSTQQALRPTLSRADSEHAQNSLDIVRSGGKNNAAKERKHQIPGFRTTPYLKIYVLRCDDKETYKENDRRKIREWIRENAQADGKQNHDACEWLILHVVVPDTIAASEPRWRESSKDPDDLKERKGGSKLIGKSTRTVFDRLRADFNDSGKSGLDRIAQIRLTKADSPGDLLPTPAVAHSYEESPQERENAWADLVSKLKSLILGPFDRRVRQYEADITEQESRRTLPGFNFCTFFIHKEGLAMALESIGLVEDALAIYDELSLGLEIVLRDMAAGQTQGTATSFVLHTEDIKERISGGTYTNGAHDDTTTETRDAASLFSKDYREKIVRSSISVFDFLCYIFLRQKALILRLANAQSARVALGSAKEGGEDLVLTSEVCWRASTFIHSTARTLKQDLMNGPTPDDLESRDFLIDGLVCSWTYTIAGMVLAETVVPALADLTRLGIQESSRLPNGASKRPATSMGFGANNHPQRTSSLPDSQSAADLTRPPTRQAAHDIPFRPGTASSLDSDKVSGLPGQAELATYRAELIMVQRKMLEQSARKRGWYAGWAFVKHVRSSRTEDMPSHDTAEKSVTTDSRAAQCQVLGLAIKVALGTHQSFQAAYESLTHAAIRHYFTATQSKSAESLLSDLGMLKCQQDDFMSAATYFQHVLPLYSSESWDLMESETLSTYSFCLKRLGRINEYVETVLALLARVSARRRDRQTLRLRATTSTMIHDDTDLDTSGMFVEVVGASEGLTDPVTQPLQSFFSDIKLDREVTHSSESDSCRVRLHIGHILDDEIQFDEAKVRLVSVDDPLQEVWLVSAGVVLLKPGLNEVELSTKSVTYGPFLVDTIILNAKKIRFIEEVRTNPEPTPLGITVIEPTTTIRDSSRLPAFIFLYPVQGAFDANLTRSKAIHIDKARHLVLSLAAGRNEVSSLEVRLKPNSAGLRIRLGDAQMNGIALDRTEAEKQGQLSLSSLASGTSATLTIPYTVEQALREIHVRLDIRYQTDNGVFTFLRSTRLPNELPLDVDVNDIFHLDTLFSSFTVRTTTAMPIMVSHAHLEESSVYAVESPNALPLPLPIFTSQPLDLVYKVRRKKVSEEQVLRRDAALALGVQYVAVDDLLVSSVVRAFTSELRQSSFEPLYRLLVPLLMERCRTCLKETDLEVAVILGEVSVPDFDAVGWQELIATLSHRTSGPLVSWLQQWHRNHANVALNHDHDEIKQHVTISVDVPTIDMVFSTSLRLPKAQPGANPEPAILTLGQPITASLQVRHNSNWSAKKVFPHVPTFKIQGESDHRTAFVVDVGNEADTWLIGGQRRRHFIPEGDDGQHTFSFMLVPLRLGLQPLPLAAVQQESSDPEIGDAQDGTSASCETHYETAGMMVHVVRDTRSAEVFIAESSTAVSRPGTAT